MDEVYLDHVPGRKAAAAYGDGLIHTGSITKVYGFGSWRLGWLIANPEFVRKCERFYDLMGVSVPPFLNWLGERLLPRLDAMREEVRGLYDERRDLVDRTLRKLDLYWVCPEHCPFGFVRLPDGTDDMEFCKRLMEERKVLLAPGSFFRQPGWVRIGWTVPLDQVRKGLLALSEAVRRA
jgi:aspartate/methionine/tyrosine aminotransferase